VLPLRSLAKALCLCPDILALLAQPRPSPTEAAAAPYEPVTDPLPQVVHQFIGSRHCRSVGLPLSSFGRGWLRLLPGSLVRLTHHDSPSDR
jgi:hypothetical protein